MLGNQREQSFPVRLQSLEREEAMAAQGKEEDKPGNQQQQRQKSPQGGWPVLSLRPLTFGAGWVWARLGHLTPNDGSRPSRSRPDSRLTRP